MFGKRLNILRKSSGVTALKIANHLNMGIHSYRKYESGHRQPSFETLIKIADFLDVSTDYLLGRSDYLRNGEILDEVLVDEC